MQDRKHLLTEQRLVESLALDQMGIEKAVLMMNDQDSLAVAAVGRVAKEIARAVELVAMSLVDAGRLFYVGAGTSGRLGVLDASECPPTFRTDPETVQGIIAGGQDAMFRSQEGAEDSPEGGASEIAEKQVAEKDVVMGIAAGGSTPFVHGALRFARDRGAKTIFLTCVQRTENEPEVDVVIRPLVGPEVITGSTRLKAGTATKLVLNTITTLAMVQLGKVYENLMVDLRATNSKLWDRGARIVAILTGLPRDEALNLLRQAEGHVKPAVVMHVRRVNLATARHLLEQSGGHLRPVIEGTSGDSK